ncbi:hypothetical protein [Streptomyces hokutonensis]|uniref:hypothetical protein n=1 Tax=Streptomyces hokutonensis TaxID=1306990 RepID=UPI0036A51F66
MARAHVVVEDVRTVLREAEDVVPANREVHLHVDGLIPMAVVVRGARTLPPDRTAVFKSVGMSWQDLVVAEEIIEQHLRGR